MKEIVFKMENKKVLAWGKFRRFPYILTGYINDINIELLTLTPEQGSKGE